MPIDSAEEFNTQDEESGKELTQENTGITTENHHDVLNVPELENEELSEEPLPEVIN